MKTTKPKTPAEANRHATLPSRSYKATLLKLGLAPASISSDEILSLLREPGARVIACDDDCPDQPLTPAARTRLAVMRNTLTSIATLTAKETAAILSVSTRTLARLRTRGLLVPVIATRTLLYPVASIAKFLRDNTAIPAADINTAH